MDFRGRLPLVAAIALMTLAGFAMCDSSDQNRNERGLGAYFPESGYSSEGGYSPESGYSQSTDYHTQYDSPLLSLPSEDQPTHTVKFSDSPNEEETRKRNSNYNPTYSSFNRLPPKNHYHNQPEQHSSRSSLKKLITIGLIIGLPLLLVIGITTMSPLLLSGFSQLNAQPTGRRKREIDFQPELLDAEEWLNALNTVLEAADE